MAGLDS
ncbi:hypothetical protein E2C01_061241 [Portunus trituberculatus]|nr:hypothetical protein [Portunus trituberculatus]